MNELYARLGTSVLVGLMAVGLFFLPIWLFTLIVLGILGYILVVEWPQLFNIHDKLFWLIMPIYPILPILIIIYLQWTGYEMLNLLLFCLVGGQDAGAYLSGKQWGRTLISPAISPGKTWEGFVGGCFFSLLLSLMFFGHNSWALLIGSVFPLVISINFAALAGDLFESSLKRHAHLKDSGDILPGHGGVLDRIDGILFAAVIVFFARNWLKLLLT